MSNKAMAVLARAIRVQLAPPEEADEAYDVLAEEMAKEFLAALADAGLAVEQAWQPIETAPRDGKVDFLIMCPAGKNWNHHQMVGRFASNGRFFSSWPGRWNYEPTHWRHLPEPPTP